MVLSHPFQDPLVKAFVNLAASHFDNATKHTSNEKYRIPETDVLESDSAYRVRVALPGAHKESIDIQFNEQLLTVKASNAPESEKMNKNHEDGKVTEDPDEKDTVHESDGSKQDNEIKSHVSQIYEGEFRKELKFPKNVDSDQISANFENGILTLDLPKATKSNKNITIG